MRQRIAALLFIIASGAATIAQAQSVFSYISRIQIGSDRAGTCYSTPPAGYPLNDFTRVAGPCAGSPTPSPSPSPSPSASSSPSGNASPSPSTAPTSSSISGGALIGITQLSFINPSSCGTAQAPLPPSSDLTGCTAGYIRMGTTSVWTYSGYTGPPVVSITPIADYANNIVFAAAPSASGFTLQSITLSTQQPNTTDTSVVSYLIFGNSGAAAATPVMLSPSTLSINIGDTPAQITASQVGNTVGYQASSDTPSVATVAVSGSTISVTGVSPGTANITVSGTAGQPSATIPVTVNALVSASANSVTILQGQQTQVTATQFGNTTFTPTSDNPSVATATQNGAITYISGVAAGTANITITGAGQHSTKVAVTVVALSANPVVVSQTSVSLNAGTSVPVGVSQVGNSAGFTVTSASPSYVTGSYASGVVTINGLLPTTSAVALTITDAGTSGQFATIYVSVTAAPLVLSQTTSSLLVGQSATVNVSQIGNGSTGYTAASSNSSSVSVVSPVVNGIVSFSAVAPTTTPATITVSGAFGQQATISVSVAANAVLVSQSTASLRVNQTAYINVSQIGNTGGFTPSTPDNGATVGTSMNNATGVLTLTGVSVTSSPTVVTVTGDGGKSATISVSVAAALTNSITLVPSSQNLANGSTGTIAYTYSGSGTLTASSNSASVTVPSTVSGGTIHITAVSPTSGTPAIISVSDGTVTSTASVTVTANPITLTPSSQTIANGSTNGTISVAQTANSNWTVASNSPSVTATINGSTVSLTGVSPTTPGAPATITVTGGGTYATATVAVSANPISLTPNALSLTAYGSTGQINAQQTANTTFTLTPSDTVGTYATFALGTPSGGVVPIIVTPHAATPVGSPVTLTVAGAGSTQTATITILPATINLGLTGNALTVQAGRIGSFTPTQPGNSTGFTATSDTPSVATVPSGTSTTISVTGVSVGTANITVSGGGNTAVVAVTVTPGMVNLSSSSVTIVAGQSVSVTASQIGNTGNAYGAGDTGGNASVLPNTNATNNIVITGLSPTPNGTPDSILVTGINSNGVVQSARISVTVTPAPVVLVSGGASTVAAGSSATFNVTEVGNPGSYTATPSNGDATASVTSESSSGATITVQGVTAGTLNIVVTGQSSTPLTVSFTVTPGRISISPNITTLSLVATTSSSAITVTEPGNTTFTATSGNTSLVSTTVTGNQIVITGNAVTSSPVNVTIGGANGAPNNPVIAVTVTAPVAITATPSPLNLANAATGSVNVSQGGNLSFEDSITSGNSAASVSSASTNNGIVTVIGSSAGGSANLHLIGVDGATLDVPVNVATPTPLGATSDAQIVSALTNAGVTNAWALNGTQPSATYAAAIGSSVITASSGTSSGVTQAFPIVDGSTYSAFFNPITGTANSTVVPTSSGFTIGIAFQSSSLTGTQEVWHAGAPFAAPNTGLALYVTSSGAVKLGYGTGSGYAALTALASVTASTGPSSAATLGHVAIVTWDGTTLGLSLDGAAPVTATPTNFTMTSGAVLGIAATTNTNATTNFLGYLQYLFYAPAAFTAPQEYNIAQVLIGAVPSSGAPAVTLQTSTNCSGSAVTNISLTVGTPQTFTICQTGYTTGFSVTTFPNNTSGSGVAQVGVSGSVITNGGNSITLTPNAAGTATSMVISGNGSVSLNITISGTHATALLDRSSARGKDLVAWRRAIGK